LGGSSETWAKVLPLAFVHHVFPFPAPSSFAPLVFPSLVLPQFWRPIATCALALLFIYCGGAAGCVTLADVLAALVFIPVFILSPFLLLTQRLLSLASSCSDSPTKYAVMSRLSVGQPRKSDKAADESDLAQISWKALRYRQ
jgi:hypothetical protein